MSSQNNGFNYEVLLKQGARARIRTLAMITKDLHFLKLTIFELYVMKWSKVSVKFFYVCVSRDPKYDAH